MLPLAPIAAGPEPGPLLTAHASRISLARRAKRGTARLSHLNVLKKSAAAEATAPKSDTVQTLYPTTLSASTHFWVTDDLEGFVVGSEKGESGKDDSCTIEIQLPGGAKEERQILRTQIGPRIDDVGDLKQGCEDMTEMAEINEATILHNLRLRHASDDIYTNIGSILISVNPFKFTNSMYTPNLVQKYAKMAKTGSGKVSPHIFALAEAAFRGLRDDHQDQSILISGESGAGKTEATKKCLQYFVEVASEHTAASGGSASVADKILSANPVLESFGNAQTVRNHNSSRFGKWMQILFDNRGIMDNCQIHNYMLETSRVVLQPAGEKNFHVFYQLVASVKPEQRKTLHLEGQKVTKQDQDSGAGQAGAFQYLRLATPRLRAIGEEEELREDYSELVTQLQHLGFADQEVLGMHELLAAILHLGECTFEAQAVTAEDKASGKATGCRIMSGSSPDSAAELWGCSVDQLGLALCNKLLRIGTDDTLVPLSVVEAQGLRDALAMSAYDRLFNFVVSKVNRSLKEQVGGGRSDTNADMNADIAPLELPKGSGTAQKKKKKQKQRVIGVLDIFGFECFEYNCFEQLCINYCNEKLQQHFIHHTVMEELSKYEEQGLGDLDALSFPNNVASVALLEQSPSGLFCLLDNQWKLGKNGSVDAFMRSMASAHQGARKPGKSTASKTEATATSAKQPLWWDGDSEHGKALGLTRSMDPATDRPQFVVGHYAAEVVYDARDFLRKNREEMQLGLKELLANSTKAFLSATLFGAAESAIRDSSRKESAAGGRTRAMTVGSNKSSRSSKMRMDMNELLHTIDASRPHFVRCIKSNQQKLPNTFEGNTVLQQLRYSGALATVTIHHSGFPYRWDYRTFHQRYHMVVTAGRGRGEAEAKSGVTTARMHEDEEHAKEVRPLLLDHFFSIIARTRAHL
jgi:myosin heavy subunit